MCEPLPETRFDGLSHTAAMDVGKHLREAGVPAPPAFGVIAGETARVFYGATKTGRADHRAIGAGETTLGNRVPVGMIEGVGQKLFEANLIDTARQPVL